ncbi:MAG TPA: iron dependent repressor, metal binding and dimerization domain protein, partial [Treponemataceae bacterium]|nr:iron dependent repressor, metal binding and dimerization domain protein [Treponemataceae bacterium]
KLTEKGLKAARQVRSRHNNLKIFLADVLGVSPETAEQDACRMEHAICRETATKLEEYLKKILTQTDQPDKNQTEEPSTPRS